MKEIKQFEMIAKTMAGLEDILAEELTDLGASSVEKGIRMVSFTGDQAMLYKSNLCCRTALRILKPVYRFTANDADEVYEKMKSFDWDSLLTLDTTFAIDAVVFSHIFRHSKYVAYRVKDAISDFFTEKYEKRPSVSITNPDITLNIHISHNKCTLSIDSSGESLHKRGYRIEQTEAPLSEVLAAGMILKSSWRGERNFIDPMCGSGTLLIEAAMIALNIPPGIYRSNFAFEKWNDFDKELFEEIYNDETSEREFTHKIIGSDISAKSIATSEKNIKNAGLQKYIELSVKPIQQYTEAPCEPGVLMTNPPYGERLKVEDLEELYSIIGERLKHVFTGFEAYVLSYKKESFDSIGLKPTQRFFPLFNGSLECEMRRYDIFEGKRDDYKKQRRDEGASDRPKRDDSSRQERRPRQESGIGRKPFADRERNKDRNRDERSFKGGDRPERGGFSERRENRFDGERRERRDNSFGGERRDRRENNFGGERREGRFSGENRERKERRFGDGEKRERREGGFERRREPRDDKPRFDNKREGGKVFKATRKENKEDNNNED